MLFMIYFLKLKFLNNAENKILHKCYPITKKEQNKRRKPAFIVFIKTYFLPRVGAILSNTPLIYLWLSSAPKVLANSIASLITTL